MKLSRVFVSSIIFLAGCTNSSVTKYTDFFEEEKPIESQTIFITKWDHSFSLDEAGCPEKWSPFLLTTKTKKNGSTTYVVQCVQRV